jgi:penicillin-binding protein 2
MEIRSGRLLALVGPGQLARAAHAPGSVMKLVAALAGFRADLGGREMECRGSDVHRGTTRYCWFHEGHGRIGLRRAVAASCDVYFYRLARLLGPGRLLEAARDLGLGTATGSDVAGEVLGHLPAALSDDEVPDFAVGRLPGLSATGLQILSLVAAIGNGGTLPTPHLRGSAGPRGRLSAGAALAEVGRAMREAVLAGTGAAAADLPMAGKTGTAPRAAPEPAPEGRSAARDPLSEDTLAWFAGYAPDEAPEVAVVAFVPEGLGSRDAAVAAADLLRVYLARPPGP